MSVCRRASRFAGQASVHRCVLGWGAVQLLLLLGLVCVSLAAASSPLPAEFSSTSLSLQFSHRSERVDSAQVLASAAAAASGAAGPAPLQYEPSGPAGTLETVNFDALGYRIEMQLALNEHLTPEAGYLSVRYEQGAPQVQSIRPAACYYQGTVIREGLRGREGEVRQTGHVAVTACQGTEGGGAEGSAAVADDDSAVITAARQLTAVIQWGDGSLWAVDPVQLHDGTADSTHVVYDVASLAADHDLQCGELPGAAPAVKDGPLSTSTDQTGVDAGVRVGVDADIPVGVEGGDQTGAGIRVGADIDEPPKTSAQTDAHDTGDVFERHDALKHDASLLKHDASVRSGADAGGAHQSHSISAMSAEVFRWSQQRRRAQPSSNNYPGTAATMELLVANDALRTTALGSAAAAEADTLSLINAVDVLYGNVGASIPMRAVVKMQVSWEGSDPISSTLDHYDLLLSWGSYLSSNHAQGSYDVAVLLTQRDLAGTVIGVAWVDTVCTTPDRANNLVQSTFSFAENSVITAHELGHNLGAAHDGYNGCPNGPHIMAPTLQTTDSWSECSVTQMQDRILAGDRNCLANNPAGLLPGGSACSNSTVCLSGSCQGGVCCGWPVDLLCSACDAATNGTCLACSEGLWNGTHCTQVPVGGNCSRASHCAGGSDGVCRGQCCRADVDPLCQSCNATGLCTACEGDRVVGGNGTDCISACDLEPLAATLGKGDAYTVAVSLGPGQKRWVRFRSSIVQQITVITCNQFTGDSVLSLYEQDCATYITGNDDACNYQSQFAVDVEPWQDYLLEVRMWGAASSGYGDVTITGMGGYGNCTLDGDCVSGRCRGGNCCLLAVDSQCQSCSVNGSCAACPGDYTLHGGSGRCVNGTDGAVCSESHHCDCRDGHCCEAGVPDDCSSCANATGECQGCAGLAEWNGTACALPCHQPAEYNLVADSSIQITGISFAADGHRLLSFYSEELLDFTATTCNQWAGDSYFELYQCGELVAANDDYCGLRSRLSYRMAAGLRYDLRVRGYAMQAGSGSVTVDTLGFAGDPCFSASQCGGADVCMGGRCCARSVNTTECEACDERGQCARCSPGSGLVLINGTCEAPRAAGERCVINGHCQGQSCRGGRCCDVGVDQYCSACNSTNGGCDACHWTHTLAANRSCLSRKSYGVTCADHQDCVGLFCDAGQCGFCLPPFHRVGAQCGGYIPTSDTSCDASCQTVLAECVNHRFETQPDSFCSTDLGLTPPVMWCADAACQGARVSLQLNLDCSTFAGESDQINHISQLLADSQGLDNDNVRFLSFSCASVDLQFAVNAPASTLCSSCVTDTLNNNAYSAGSVTISSTTSSGSGGSSDTDPTVMVAVSAAAVVLLVGAVVVVLVCRREGRCGGRRRATQDPQEPAIQPSISMTRTTTTTATAGGGQLQRTATVLTHETVSTWLVEVVIPAGAAVQVVSRRVTVDRQRGTVTFQPALPSGAATVRVPLDTHIVFGKGSAVWSHPQVDRRFPHHRCITVQLPSQRVLNIAVASAQEQGELFRALHVARQHGLASPPSAQGGPGGSSGGSSGGSFDFAQSLTRQPTILANPTLSHQQLTAAAQPPPASRSSVGATSTVRSSGVVTGVPLAAHSRPLGPAVRTNTASATSTPLTGRLPVVRAGSQYYAGAANPPARVSSSGSAVVRPRMVQGAAGARYPPAQGRAPPLPRSASALRLATGVGRVGTNGGGGGVRNAGVVNTARVRSIGPTPSGGGPSLSLRAPQIGGSAQAGGGVNVRTNSHAPYGPDVSRSLTGAGPAMTRSFTGVGGGGGVPRSPSWADQLRHTASQSSIGAPVGPAPSMGNDMTTPPPSYDELMPRSLQ